MIYDDIKLNKSTYTKYHLPHCNDLYSRNGKLSLNAKSIILIRKKNKRKRATS